MRERQRGVAEEGIGAVGGGVVDDGQLEGLAGAAQARQARAGERELVVDDEDHGDQPGDCSTRPGETPPPGTATSYRSTDRRALVIGTTSAGPECLAAGHLVRIGRERIGQAGLLEHFGQDEVDDLGRRDVGQTGQPLDRLTHGLAEANRTLVKGTDLTCHPAHDRRTDGARRPNQWGRHGSRRIRCLCRFDDREGGRRGPQSCRGITVPGLHSRQTATRGCRWLRNPASVIWWS